MSYTDKFAERLINLREQRGITQQELADMLGITRQSLSLYEKAERTINIELLAKIAEQLNVTPDYLLGVTEAQTRNIDARNVCDYTGLNDKALDNVINIKELGSPHISETLNSLLGIDEFYGFIMELDAKLHPEIYEKIIEKEIAENDVKQEITPMPQLASQKRFLLGLSDSEQINMISNSFWEYILKDFFDRLYNKYKAREV